MDSTGGSARRLSCTTRLKYAYLLGSITSRRALPSAVSYVRHRAATPLCFPVGGEVCCATVPRCMSAVLSPAGATAAGSGDQASGQGAPSHRDSQAAEDSRGCGRRAKNAMTAAAGCKSHRWAGSFAFWRRPVGE